MNIFASNIKEPKVTLKFVYENELEDELEYLKPVFTGKTKETYTILYKNQKEFFTVLVGLGKREEFTLENLRNAMGKFARTVRDLNANTAQITKADIPYCDEEIVSTITEGLHLGLYEFDKYKSDKKEKVLPKFYLNNFDEKAGSYIEKTFSITESIYLARDLINEPSTTLYPEKFANIAKENCEKVGLDVKVLEEKELEKLGMNALLAVGNGSKRKPRLIIIRHLKGGNKEILGLVGKGLTCDTGGYSLKSTASMRYQKTDMSGASNVIAIMLSLAKNNIDKNVVAVIPTCENVISPFSYKVGDVITSMAGKTIEVLNTDAEGRLALADAITYIIKNEKISSLIDMATLTGAVGATFGNIYTGLFANNEEFYNKFMKSANIKEEKYWRLPLDNEYKELIKSDVADIKNVASAGTITAAMFLKEFVQEVPWIHLDIASTASTNPAKNDYNFKGATGVTIRTIYNLINNIL